MSISDHEYFAQRAAEERAAAERSDNSEAERSHLELALRYQAAAAAAIGLPVVQLKVAGESSSIQPE